MVIFKFWSKSHTCALAEILKIDSFWSLSSLTVKKCERCSKWSNSIVNMIYMCYLDEWNKIKKFGSFSNQEVLVIFKFWLKSHTWALAEFLKIVSFWSLSSLTVKMQKWFKMIKFDCKHSSTSWTGFKV